MEKTTSGHHYKSGPLIIRVLKNLTLKQTHLSFFWRGCSYKAHGLPMVRRSMSIFSDESKFKVKLI